MKHPSEQYEIETGKYHYDSSKINFVYSCEYVEWLEQKLTNQAKNNEVSDLVMLTPDAIAKHIGWDGYHHMMINEDHIGHQLKESINMLFFTNKLEVPFG